MKIEILGLEIALKSAYAYPCLPAMSKVEGIATCNTLSVKDVYAC